MGKLASPHRTSYAATSAGTDERRARRTTPPARPATPSCPPPPPPPPPPRLAQQGGAGGTPGNRTHYCHAAYIYARRASPSRRTKRRRNSYAHYTITINHNTFTVTKHNKAKGKKHQHHLYTTAARLSRRLGARTQEATQGHPSARLQVTQRYVTIRARCLSMLILVPSDASVCRIHRELAAARRRPPTPAQYLREIAVSCRQYCANPVYSADYPRYYPVP